MAMDLGLKGKRAAVAAASAGLGFATAAALAEEGVRVAICGRRAEKVEEAVARLGGDAVGIVCDVGRPQDAARFVSDAADALGGVDILVPNAGGPPAGTFESTEVDAYGPALDLNLVSTVAMCKAAVPTMQANGWGRVVAITSIAVRQPVATLILSNTARAGVTAFLSTLAREVAADGVTVNSVQPGFHATDRVTALHGDEAAISRLVQGIPAKAIGQPEDFGHVAAFLCSEHARYITGAHLQVDGGSYAGLL